MTPDRFRRAPRRARGYDVLAVDLFFASLEADGGLDDVPTVRDLRRVAFPLVRGGYLVGAVERELSRLVAERVDAAVGRRVGEWVRPGVRRPVAARVDAPGGRPVEPVPRVNREVAHADAGGGRSVAKHADAAGGRSVATHLDAAGGRSVAENADAVCRRPVAELADPVVAWPVPEQAGRLAARGAATGTRPSVGVGATSGAAPDPAAAASARVADIARQVARESADVLADLGADPGQRFRRVPSWRVGYRPGQVDEAVELVRRTLNRWPPRGASSGQLLGLRFPKARGGYDELEVETFVDHVVSVLRLAGR